MDFPALPVEILEQILDNLSFDDLLNCSLVCRRWNATAERLVLQRSRFSIRLFAGKQSSSKLADVTRNYRVVQICYRDDRWHELQALLEICTKNMHPRAVVISEILADHLNRLYLAYHHWWQPIEEVKIYLDDRDCQNLRNGSERFTLQFPNLKQLHWFECLYQLGEKTVIVDAPNLRKLILKNSLDSTAGLEILDCSKLQHLECTFYTRNLADVFGDGAFPELKTLELDSSVIEEDVKLLRQMPQLTRLVLNIVFSEKFSNFSSELCSAISNCRTLEHLQLTINCKNCSISLSELTKHLVNLKHLHLQNVTANDESTTLSFPSLKSMTLENFSLLDNTTIINLNAPKLDSLSISAPNLSRIFTVNESRLRQLNVDLDTLSLRETIETHLVPFLDRFGNVKNLVLARLTHFEYHLQVQDSFIAAVPLSLETLCLHSIGFSLDCLVPLSGWKHLQELSIINCLIDTDGVHKTVTLANLKRLHVVKVQLSDGCCREFAIIGPHCELIRAEVEEDGAIYYSNCWNH